MVFVLKQHTEIIKAALGPKRSTGQDSTGRHPTFDIKHVARMDKYHGGISEYRPWLEDLVTVVGSTDSGVGNQIKELVDQDNHKRKTRKEDVMVVTMEDGSDDRSGQYRTNL